jgi:uncharacterized HhH-GPD family protein
VQLHLSQDPEADALLSKSPFALLVGMVLDQQVPLEWAFASPKELQRRLGGTLEPRQVAEMDPNTLTKAFTDKPALHRYPGSMATRVHELAKLIVERYDGRTEKIWTGTSSGAELLKRIKELPGFGDQKAKIFVALLGKQLQVRPPGWEAVSAPFSDGGSYRSVADIADEATLGKVRAFKQELKATHKAADKGAHKAGDTGAHAAAHKRGRAAKSAGTR